MDDVTGDSPARATAPGGLGSVVAGRYHLRGRLGRGATKEVYLAYDERLDRDVALAIVLGTEGSEAALERVAREAQVTGRLGDHPNVVTIFDTGAAAGIPYLVLRVMPGGSLAELIRSGRVEPSRAVRLGRDVATALAHAHAHGVVHRDVKPDNVWLAADGTAALGDFGIARREEQQRLTATGEIVGTVRYVSPEQIAGADAEPASDLYALGVTLYELLTGRAPFLGRDAAHLFSQHLNAVPVPPSQLAPGVPAGLEALILALLEKEPRARPASARVVAEELSGDIARIARRRVAAVVAVRGDALPADRCAAAIEEHGGEAQRQPGAGVLGIFGLAGSRGDDALRAARAAVHLRDLAPALRLGVDAGEVVAHRTVTGAPVTGAWALAGRAAAGEIRLGEAARAALGTQAEADAEGRLLLLHADRPAVLRTPATPFLGRERELGELHAALAAVTEQRTCGLVTVLGPAGVGKSRLAGEFLAAAAAEAQVLAGRCPPYGEGSAFGALAGALGRVRIETLLDEPAGRALRAAIEPAGGPVRPQETAWAFRRLLERLAADRPVILAVEDIHWAGAALLDVLDHVAAFSGGSPVLVLCLARPELLDARPSWATPQAGRSVLTVRPLPEEEGRRLAEGLGAGGRAERIAARAEGNPLFIEQLVAVDADEDELPTSIHSVLAARIDQLAADERALLQRASVEGRTFHVGALLERDDDLVLRLVRKGLLGADRPAFAGQSAFRFSHALIRDAAYAGIPKDVRARWHADVAAWLEAQPGAADEVVAHQLEQACRLAAELGTPRPELTASAIARLQRAAAAALARADAAASSGLVERALALERRTPLLVALGEARLEEGRPADAARALDDAIAEATDDAVLARAQVEREIVRLVAEPHAATGEALAVAEAALPRLDDLGRSRAWTLCAHVHWMRGEVGRAEDAWAQADRTGDERGRFAVVGWRATAAVLGPAPVAEAIRLCDSLRAQAGPVALAWILNPLASLHAMRGDFARAEACLQEADAILDQLGGRGASVSHHAALVWLLARRFDRAEAALRPGVETLAAMEDADALATTKAMLAEVLAARGALEEAGELCAAASAIAAEDDVVTQVVLRGVQARLLAARGHDADAEAVAREAVALAEPTDLLSHHGDALLTLAEVLPRREEARAAAEAALALYRRKGNAARAAVATSLLEGAPGVIPLELRRGHDE